MENLIDFFRMFFTTDYFLILLIILLLIVLVIIIHLIRLQRYEGVKIIEEPKEEEENFLTLNFGNELLEDDLLEALENEKVNEKITEQFESIDKILENNEIFEYEKDEEDSAIISTEELEKIKANRNLEENSNASLINQYEEEQEKKAIISYEELLRNASSLKLNYKEETNIEPNGPVVRKVEIETPVIDRSVNYSEETDFLSTLKDFRTQLK